MFKFYPTTALPHSTILHGISFSTPRIIRDIGDETFGERLQDSLDQAIRGRKKYSLIGTEVRKHDEAEGRKIIRRVVEELGMTLYKLEKRKYIDLEKQMLTTLLRKHTG